MSMPNESVPPIRDLPDEIETAIDNVVRQAVTCTNMPSDAHRHMAHQAQSDLRHAIRAALDEAWNGGFHQAVTGHEDDEQALRERCERLRICLRRLTHNDDQRIVMVAIGNCDGTLQPGDLADDLRPRGGDER